MSSYLYFQGKNTNIYGCFFVCAKLLQSYLTLCDPMNCKPSKFLCSWDSPSKNTGVGCHALLQGILKVHGTLFYPHKGPQAASLYFF